MFSRFCSALAFAVSIAVKALFKVATIRFCWVRGGSGIFTGDKFCLVICG